MYSRIRIAVTDDSSRDLVAMFQKAFTSLPEKQKAFAPNVVSR